MEPHEIAISVVSRLTGISTSDILCHSRLWPLVRARQFVILLLMQDGYTSTRLARILARTPCTIHNSKVKANSNLAYSKTFAQKYQEISNAYHDEKSLRAS